MHLERLMARPQRGLYRQGGPRLLVRVLVLQQQLLEVVNLARLALLEASMLHLRTPGGGTPHAEGGREAALTNLPSKLRASQVGPAVTSAAAS